jgi:hypothetical protein
VAETGAAHRDDTAYEHSDAPPALIAKIAAGLAATIVAVPLVMLVAFPGALNLRPRQTSVVPPAPRLQDNEFRDLAALRQAEEARLKSYGWVDRDRRLVHVPIEQAMRSLAERGAPGWPKTGAK